MPELAAPLIAWYRANARDLPWRRPGFGAWGTLVSEFMLQQTPVTRVIPHLEAWLARWPPPPTLAADAPAEAVRQWANLGYPRRALWLHRAAVEIRDRHAGSVPRDVEDLLALSGIGDYTARAVAVFAYGMRHPVVDTNTRRVLARAVDGRSQPARRPGATAAMAAHPARRRRRRRRGQRGDDGARRRRSARPARRGATHARSPDLRAGALPGTPTRATSDVGRRATRAATVRRAGPSSRRSGMPRPRPCRPTRCVAGLARRRVSATGRSTRSSRTDSSRHPPGHSTCLLSGPAVCAGAPIIAEGRAPRIAMGPSVLSSIRPLRSCLRLVRPHRRRRSHRPRRTRAA